MAIPQEYFGKPSVGYFEVLLCGKAAEEEVGQIKIGQTLKLKGSLWSRTYKNRQGVRLSETKILIGSIKGESHEKS